LRSAIPCSTSTAQRTASTTLEKFDQQPVAGGLDDPAPMLLDLRITQLAADRLQRGERALLVRPHQPRIARDIGGQDRGETAGLAHT